MKNEPWNQKANENSNNRNEPAIMNTSIMLWPLAFNSDSKKQAKGTSQRCQCGIAMNYSGQSNIVLVFEHDTCYQQKSNTYKKTMIAPKLILALIFNTNAMLSDKRNAKR